MIKCERLWMAKSHALGFVLCTFFAISFVAELWLISIHTSWAYLQATLPDEFYFIEVAKNNFNHFGMGYGPVFWGVLQLILKLSPTQWEVLVARVVFVLAKYAAFAIITRVFWQKGQKVPAAIFLLALLGSPGFLFLGKIISPEYELLFWVALSVKALIEDQGRLGTGYLWAIFFAFLATLTKLSGLPLFIILVVYGLASGAQNARNDVVKPYVILVARMTVLLAALVLAMYLFPWQRNILIDINEMFQRAVPPLVFDADSIKFAWRYDGITWDQIKQGGIQKDFLPTFSIAVVATILLNGCRREKIIRPVWAIYLVAVVTTISTIFHSMGHTWYLFLPSILFATVGAQLAGCCSRRVQIIVLLVVLLTAAVSMPRLQERVEFKLANNREIKGAAMDASEMVQDALGRYPCIRSAAFDVLIPWQQNNLSFLPMRIALQMKLNKEYVLPDLLLLNVGLPSGARSPLLDFVIKDQLNAYKLLSATKRVELYIKKDLQCMNEK